MNYNSDFYKCKGIFIYFFIGIFSIYYNFSTQLIGKNINIEVNKPVNPANIKKNSIDINNFNDVEVDPNKDIVQNNEKNDSNNTVTDSNNTNPINTDSNLKKEIENFQRNQQILEEQQIIYKIIGQEVRLDSHNREIKYERQRKNSFSLGTKDKPTKIIGKILDSLSFFNVEVNNLKYPGVNIFTYSFQLASTAIIQGEGLLTVSLIGDNFFIVLLPVYLLLKISRIFFINSDRLARLSNFAQKSFPAQGTFFNSYLPLDMQVKQKNFFQSVGFKMEMNKENKIYGLIYRAFLSKTGSFQMNFFLYLFIDIIYSLKLIGNKKKKERLTLISFFSFTSDSLLINDFKRRGKKKEIQPSPAVPTNPPAPAGSKTKSPVDEYDDAPILITRHNGKDYGVYKTAKSSLCKRFLYRKKNIYGLLTRKANIHNQEFKTQFSDNVNGKNIIENYLEPSKGLKLPHSTLVSNFEKIILGLGFQKQLVTEHLPYLQIYTFFMLIFVLGDSPIEQIKNFQMFAFGISLSHKKTSFCFSIMRQNLKLDVKYQKKYDLSPEIISKHLLFSIEKDTVKVNGEEYTLFATT